MSSANQRQSRGIYGGSWANQRDSRGITGIFEPIRAILEFLLVYAVSDLSCARVVSRYSI